MKRCDYKIVKEKVTDGDDIGYMYDVYIKSEGQWTIIDSFQFKENAEKFIENDMAKEGA